MTFPSAVSGVILHPAQGVKQPTHPMLRFLEEAVNLTTPRPFKPCGTARGFIEPTGRISRYRRLTRVAGPEASHGRRLQSLLTKE